MGSYRILSSDSAGFTVDQLMWHCGKLSSKNGEAVLRFSERRSRESRGTRWYLIRANNESNDLQTMTKHRCSVAELLQTVRKLCAPPKAELPINAIFYRPTSAE